DRRCTARVPVPLTNRRPKVPLLTGAEPFRHERGETAVLLCHGFTGSPQSLRPWAEHLAGRGLTVSLPLLPGHGTRWEDLRVTGGRAARGSSWRGRQWAVRWPWGWTDGTGRR